MSTAFSLARGDNTVAFAHVDQTEHRFQRLKVNIHQRLVESLDLSQIERMGELPQWSSNVRRWVTEACGADQELLKEVDQERLAEDLLAEVFGLGPLEGLMNDPDVSDILVNGPYTVYVERHGRLELTNCLFADDAHLMRIIQRIVGRLGRRIDEMSPMVDARLPDGSRVNAIIPPLAIEGATLSIRRFGVGVLDLDDLLANGSLVREMAEFLAAVIRARIGCVISGGTGAGKTTLLNVLSTFIPATERVITVEDSAELKFQHRHWVRLETRTANTEGAGEVPQRDLVRNCLRMRPDRIIVGEVRGAEVWDMLQAMNTGHDGSLTTIHANSASDALARLEMMVALTGFELPISVVRQYIACGIGLIVQLARLTGGPRRVMRISELLRVEGNQYVMEDIFGYEQRGIDADGMAEGEFFVTGYRPTCLERMQSAGIQLSDSLFQSRRIAEPRRAAPPKSKARKERAAIEKGDAFSEVPEPPAPAQRETTAKLSQDGTGFPAAPPPEARTTAAEPAKNPPIVHEPPSAAKAPAPPLLDESEFVLPEPPAAADFDENEFVLPEPSEAKESALAFQEPPEAIRFDDSELAFQQPSDPLQFEESELVLQEPPDALNLEESELILQEPSEALGLDDSEVVFEELPEESQPPDTAKTKDDDDFFWEVEP